MQYQCRTQITSNIELSLLNDVREYCKERRITLSQLLNEVLIERLEKSKSIANSS